MNAEDDRPHVGEGAEAANEPMPLQDERPIVVPQDELPGSQTSDSKHGDGTPLSGPVEDAGDAISLPSQAELSGLLSILHKVTSGRSHDADPAAPGTMQFMDNPGVAPGGDAELGVGGMGEEISGQSSTVEAVRRGKQAPSLSSGDRLLSFVSSLGSINMSQAEELFGIYQSEARARFQQQQTAQELVLRTERQKAELRLQQDKFESEMAKLKADIEHQQELRRLEIRKESTGEIARSVVLLLVVLAVVLTPLLAMGWFKVSAQSFSQYVAPITGITGTVLGYWFGRQDPRK